MPVSVRKWNCLTGLACCVAAVGLLCAPSTLTDLLQASVRDAVHPGSLLITSAIEGVRKLAPRSQSESANLAQLEATATELQESQRRERRLRSELAVLRGQLESLKRTGTRPIQPSSSAPLIIAELLEARILGEESGRCWQSGRLIGRGASSGVQPSEFVLSAETTIDQGHADHVAPGHPVYAGRCVVGKVRHVGRWTSTLQPVTDADYRGTAQLARRVNASAAGGVAPIHEQKAEQPGVPRSEDNGSVVFGAKGVLEGQGHELCRLTLISSSEPVNVGDEVYTGERDALFPYPMYYGRVVQAELRPGASYWDIRVQPAVALEELETVEVLRKSINPVRLTDSAPSAPISNEECYR